MSSPPPSPGSVALFIDWENFKYSLYEVSRLPNIPALLQAVEQRYGRPTLMRAYADWQDYYHRRSWDQMNLYQAGIEPVYVPARRSPFGPERIKNSVDVRMSLDCLEVSFTDPHVRTFVLVAGDADFLHVAAALRRRGAQVVMIGVSGSTSSRLEGVVNEVIFYDEEIDRAEAVPVTESPGAKSADLPPEPPKSPLVVTPPVRPVSPEPAVPKTSVPKTPALKTTLPETKLPEIKLPEIKLPEMSLQEGQAILMRLIREQREAEGGRNYPPLLSWLHLQMRERAPRFLLEKHGFDGFKSLLAEMQTQELLLVEMQGMVNRVWLAEDKAQVVQSPPLPPHVAQALAEPDNVPAELRRDFADIVLTADDIENSHRDYMAKGLLARFLYNKGHWDPADLPPQAAPPQSEAWRYRELPEIHKLIEDALDMGVLFRETYVDSYSGSEIQALQLNGDHAFVRKTFAQEQAGHK